MGAALGSIVVPARSASVTGLIASAKTSVCAVGTFSALDSPRFGFRGSGFFVGDGSKVATCWHVLPEASGDTRPGRLAVQLTAADGTLEVREAELASSHRQHDLAVLKVKGPPVRPLPVSRASPIEGTEFVLVGFPIGGVLGFRQVSHRGMIASIVASSLPTATSRQLTEGAVARLREGSFEMLQLDATAYPGNSGGPLLDAMTGEVLGVVNMVLLKGQRESALSHPSGISYAVPARYLVDLLSRA
jgi:S1-C subfamily serine protease